MLCAICLLSLGLSSCSKSGGNDSPSQKTRTELLTARLWKISSVGLDNNGDNKPDLDLPLENCEKDDTFEFKTDGTGINYAGTKCESDDPDTQNFTWSLKNEDKVLQIAIPGSLLSGEATILQLNDNTMEVYLDYAAGPVPTRIIVKLIH